MLIRHVGPQSLQPLPTQLGSRGCSFKVLRDGSNFVHAGRSIWSAVPGRGITAVCWSRLNLAPQPWTGCHKPADPWDDGAEWNLASGVKSRNIYLEYTWHTYLPRKTAWSAKVIGIWLNLLAVSCAGKEDLNQLLTQTTVRAQTYAYAYEWMNVCMYVCVY